MKKKMYRNIKFILHLAFVFVLYGGVSSAQDLLGKLATPLKDIKSALLGFAVAAASIGVATGVLMKKFSMGKQDRIETGNRVIRESIIGFFVLAITPLLVDWIIQITGNTEITKIVE